MFEIVKQAGLSVTEFAVIVGVSRVAAYNWKRGRTRPHLLLQQRVECVMSALETGIANKALPLPETDSNERHEKILALRDSVAAYPRPAS